jgi:outer membrane protein assembly factor BamE (lipoprotein component of BamABCDE complex)
MVLAGCQSAQQHAASVEAANSEAERLTVGTVQREIRVGMSGAEVAAALGAPNIVTTDEARREVWVYDKISTAQAYSTSQGGVSALILGGALIGSGLAGGAVGPGYSASAGASATTQKTLTVVIKYDDQGKVRDFAYHTSTF